MPKTMPERLASLEAKLDGLEKDVDEAKGIALSAKKKECLKEELLKEMKMKINQWDKWWKGIMLSVIGAILSVAGFVWSLDNRTSAVEQGVVDVKESVEDVTEQVKTVNVTQTQIKEAIKKQDKSKEDDTAEMKRAFKKAVLEAISESDKRKRHR